MASITRSFALTGIEGYPVEIETDTLYGQPSISIIGLGDRAIKEASDRIQAAIIHEKYEFPKMKIVINLAPGNIKKKGSHFDLGMAVGLLLQSGQIELAEFNISDFGFVGELSLNGKLRPCSGVLPMVITAKENGFRNIIVPEDNAQEAALVKDIDIYGFEDLKSVTNFLEGKESAVPTTRENMDIYQPDYSVDFEEVRGQEILLAHNAVLFLDEITEFNKRTLEALRQPMEDKQVTIARVNYTNSYPANFMLIAAMNPCSCGHYGTKKCKCTDYEVLKYRRRISGPILDRIDIQKYVYPVEFAEVSRDKGGMTSLQLRKRVEKARDIQRKRYKNLNGINCNAQMTPELIKQYCQVGKESRELLKKSYNRFEYSARTYNKFLKVARTFADLDGSERIRKKDIAGVLQTRDLDKEKTEMCTV